MHPDTTQLTIETLQLAARHGLHLTGPLTYNEQGLDFRIAFGADAAGRKWVLRIPRRASLGPKIAHEARVLNLVKLQLAAQVPDWQICTAELVAYPMLTDTTALSFDAQTYAVTWHMDQSSPVYISSLAALLVDLHKTPQAAADAAGIPCLSPEAARGKVFEDLLQVKREIGIRSDLEAQWRGWIDDDRLWPSFSVLVHGDLYAGHITVDAAAHTTGVIDWSEAEVSDPSIDFSGHLAAFGRPSLDALVAAYERAGGRTWQTMADHVAARLAAAPLKYGLFAIASKSQEHLLAAKVQLGVG